LHIVDLILHFELSGFDDLQDQEKIDGIEIVFVEKIF
jgi:hypothetical protein